MQIVEYVLFAAGFYPLYVAWRRARGTSLFHTIHWAAAAWLAWGLTLLDMSRGHPNPGTILALSLTGGAGVAVLGARQPIVTAWNFVVLGLLAVMLLPVAEMTLLGARSLDWLRRGFLIVTLAIAIINYIPTRFGLAAFVLGLGCAGELIGVLAPEPLPLGGDEHLIRLCWLTTPWLALVRLPTEKGADELDSLWRSFRDGWGLVWGQRVREQFNRSAANAHWHVKLTWFGFAMQGQIDAEKRTAVRATFVALLTRFRDVDAPKK
jgi:hypothetical protein